MSERLTMNQIKNMISNGLSSVSDAELERAVSTCEAAATYYAASSEGDRRKERTERNDANASLALIEAEIEFRKARKRWE